MDSTPVERQWCSAVALTCLGVALWWALYSSGGLYPSTRAMSLIAIALSAGLLQFCGAFPEASPLESRIRLPFFLLLALIFFQSIPFPYAFMRVLSPTRADLMHSVLRITGQAGWSPINVDSPMSFLELNTLLGCILVFFVTRQLSFRLYSHRWWIMAPVLIAGLAEAILGLVQAGDASGPATAEGTFLNRNHLAGFLELLLPFTLIGGWSTVRSRRLSAAMRFAGSLTLFVCGLIFLVAIFYTYSRMGSFVVVFTLLFTAVLTLWPYVRVAPRRLFAVAALLVLFTVAASSLAPQRLVSRLENASPLDRTSTDLRFGFWRDSFPLVESFWMTGCGLGGFESVFPRYQTTGTSFRVEYAHNDYLQALIELGVPAFLTGLYLLVSLVTSINRSVWFGVRPEDKLIAIACLSSTSGMLIHSLVDFNLHIPANSITLAWILGLALGTKSDAGTVLSGD